MIVMERLPKRRRARGSRLIEALIVITVMLGIVVILAPKETGDRMNANETAVIRELQIINTMQVQYKSKFPEVCHHAGRIGGARCRSHSVRVSVRRQGRVRFHPGRDARRLYD
jgi:hypothetical protein